MSLGDRRREPAAQPFKRCHLAAIEEGANLLQGADPFGAEVSRSAPHDISARRLSLTPRGKPVPSPGSRVLGQDSPLAPERP